MISFKEKCEEDGLNNTDLKEEYKRIDGIVHFMEGARNFNSKFAEKQKVVKDSGPAKKHFNEDSTTMKNLNEFIATVMMNLF